MAGRGRLTSPIAEDLVTEPRTVRWCLARWRQGSLDRLRIWWDPGWTAPRSRRSSTGSGASPPPAASTGRTGRAGRSQALVRGHWSVENRLHFVRDVVLGEDACRVRSDDAPHVFAAVRNAALNLLRGAGHERIASATR